MSIPSLWLFCVVRRHAIPAPFWYLLYASRCTCALLLLVVVALLNFTENMSHGDPLEGSRRRIE